MKSFVSQRCKNSVHNFINSMVEEKKYHNDVIKKNNKDHVMTKEDHENFENSTKCWIYGNNYVDNDVKVRDHCHISGKFRGSAHGDCNIDLKLNYKIPIAFHNLKSYEYHLIMEELGKFSLKVNVIPKEKYEL